MASMPYMPRLVPKRLTLQLIENKHVLDNFYGSNYFSTSAMLISYFPFYKLGLELFSKDTSTNL